MHSSYSTLLVYSYQWCMYMLQKRVKKKRTHKKKPRLPKGFDPSQPNGGLPPPDPERWLPKWERSDFKKKKKKSSARDKETKSGGAQVRRLQTWLHSHGFLFACFHEGLLRSLRSSPCLSSLFLSLFGACMDGCLCFRSVPHP